MQTADLVIRVHLGVTNEQKNLVEENSFLTPCLSAYSPVQKRSSVKGRERKTEGEKALSHVAPGNGVIWDFVTP